MKNKKSTTLFCFSPPVMVATFVIEILLLIYVAARYKMNALTRLVALALLLLAIFQFAEFNVCAGSDELSSLFSRLGYISITLLPPVGLHIISVLSRRVPRSILGMAYLSSIAFAVVFGLGAETFEGHICANNYAIFQLRDDLGGAYFVYYYLWLLVGIVTSLYFSIAAKAKIRKALIFQALGYLSFLLPTGIVNALNPQTVSGIPSIMCGFAVLYALVLTFGIAPTKINAKK